MSLDGAEGATAPETLRLMDRTVGDALESSPSVGSPKEQPCVSLRQAWEISQVLGQRGRGKAGFGLAVLCNP